MSTALMLSYNQHTIAVRYYLRVLMMLHGIQLKHMDLVHTSHNHAREVKEQRY